MLVISKDGEIDVLSIVQPFQRLSTLMDLSERIITTAESGVLGIAIHPDFSSNFKFYVSYSCNSVFCPIGCRNDLDCENGATCNGFQCEALGNIPHWLVIEEFKMNSNNQIDSSHRRRIFQTMQPFPTHNGGAIHFGPDGMLYLALGDGGAADDPFNLSQNKESLLGAILRIDINKSSASKNYTIPVDNPFVAETGIKEEIWAYGLRNPWQFSIDRESGRIICGDVGQNDVEEINLILKGGNYGWRTYEGSIRNPQTMDDPDFSNKLSPILEYFHPGKGEPPNGRCVIGGVIYKGTKNPCLCGSYLFADFEDDLFFSGVENPPISGIFDLNVLKPWCSGESPIPCVSPENVVHFGEDTNGEVYIVSLTDGIWRIVDPKLCGVNCPCDCLIDGQCLQVGDTNPALSCQFCDKNQPCRWSGCGDTKNTPTNGEHPTSSATSIPTSFHSPNENTSLSLHSLLSYLCYFLLSLMTFQ